MTILLKQLLSLINLLNSDTGSNQIAAGITCGLILGFAPLISLQVLLVLICVFMLRIQIGAALISAFFFALVAWLFDPVFGSVGVAILEAESMRTVFAAMYNMPLIPLTHFNNSITMGAGVTSLALAPIIFFASKRLIMTYREQVVQRFKSSRLWRLWTGTVFFKMYSTYEKFQG